MTEPMRALEEQQGPASRSECLGTLKTAGQSSRPTDSSPGRSGASSCHSNTTGRSPVRRHLSRFVDIPTEPTPTRKSRVVVTLGSATPRHPSAEPQRHRCRLRNQRQGHDGISGHLLNACLGSPFPCRVPDGWEPPFHSVRLEVCLCSTLPIGSCRARDGTISVMVPSLNGLNRVARSSETARARQPCGAAVLGRWATPSADGITACLLMLVLQSNRRFDPYQRLDPDYLHRLLRAQKPSPSAAQSMAAAQDNHPQNGSASGTPASSRTHRARSASDRPTPYRDPARTTPGSATQDTPSAGALDRPRAPDQTALLQFSQHFLVRFESQFLLLQPG